MTHDEWIKKLPNGETVYYTSDFLPGNGGTITAKKGSIVQTAHADEFVTREEVEAEFRNILIAAKS